MGWGNHHSGHKKTMCCPVKGCKYTSRRFLSMFFKSDKAKNRYSNESTKCPLHQRDLVDKHVLQ